MRVADERSLCISNLCEKINEYQEAFPLTEQQMTVYENSKADLNNLYLDKAKGLIFRSRVRWFEEGEKNTKYFFALEKARYNAKMCRKIIDEHGHEYTTDEQIMQQQEKFYSALYDKEEGVSFSIQNNHNVCLSPTDSDQIDGPISQNELAQALKHMKNDKTPGQDGLSVEIYKLFWRDLSQPYLNMLEECFEEGLSAEIKTGILNLIPKGGKDTRKLQNLRPITLLNTDYKLLEKVLAMRLDKVLPDLIHKDQTGFMKGRVISTNIRKLLDVIQHCHNEDIPAVILNLDFIKCFDRISFECIMGCLDFFKIPVYIKKWIQNLYTDFAIKIQNNGKFTAPSMLKDQFIRGGVYLFKFFSFVQK